MAEEEGEGVSFGVCGLPLLPRRQCRRASRNKGGEDIANSKIARISF
jgi:hypothetical protein